MAVQLMQLELAHLLLGAPDGVGFLFAAGRRVNVLARLRVTQAAFDAIGENPPLAVAAGLREGMALRLAGSDLSGKLIAIGRAVDPASQTVLLRAEIGKGAETLSPGQVIAVDIAAPAGAQQRLPAAAIARHQGATLAFIQTASGEQGSSFEVRPVRIVSQGGDSVTVDGLKPGERVAVKGVSGLKAMLTGVGVE